MRLAVPKEIREGETRVAATPESVKKFKGLGLDVVVQAGAGAGIFNEAPVPERPDHGAARRGITLADIPVAAPASHSRVVEFVAVGLEEVIQQLLHVMQMLIQLPPMR